MTERFTQFTLRISRLHKLIQKLKTNGMSRFGLKAVDTLCLYQLSQQDSLSFSQVAERCDLDPALVSRTLGSLTRAGMVEKDGLPGKYHARYSLTALGRERTAEIVQVICAVQAKADEGVDPAELEIFYRVLDQLTQNFEVLVQNPSGMFTPLTDNFQEEKP